MTIIAVCQSPRATVQTHTSAAPAPRKARAHALVVAPVVNTSSTITMRRPANRMPGRTAKAFFMFPARCSRVSSVWVAVGWTRRRIFSFIGIPVARARCAASRVGLVEFAFPQLQRMQRHRHDEIPSLSAQGRRGLAHQQVGEEIFKPQRAGVFEAMNGFQHDRPGDDRRARGTEMQFQLAAVGAFKSRGDVAGVGQPATLAERRADEADARPALRADQVRRAQGRNDGGRAGRFRDRPARGRL